MWKLNDVNPADMRWEKKYFVLEGNSFSYYSTIAFYSRATKKAKRSNSIAMNNTTFPLARAMVVPSRITVEGKYGIMVVPEPISGFQAKTWILCCDSNDGPGGRKEWLKKLAHTADGPRVFFEFA